MVLKIALTSYVFVIIRNKHHAYARLYDMSCYNRICNPMDLYM